MNVLTKCSTTLARIVLDILHTFNKPFTLLHDCQRYDWSIQLYKGSTEIIFESGQTEISFFNRI